MPETQLHKSFKTTLNLIASVVGVGIFALPYAFQNALPLAIFILCLTAVITVILDIICIELIYTKGMGVHQLPGIIGKIFGKKTKNVLGTILLISRTGILFLYTIVLGDFAALIIRNIFGVNISHDVLAVLLTVLCALAIKREIRFLSNVNLWLSLLKIAIIATISIAGIAALQHAQVINIFKTSNFTNTSLLLKIGIIYGVSLAATSGTAGIPAMKEIADKKTILRNCVIIASVIVVILYSLFSVYVIGKSTTVSAEALLGLGNSWTVTLLAIAGLICVATAYMSAGNSLYEIYEHDYSLPDSLAWSLLIVPPLTLYFLGIRDFTLIVGILGAVIGGIEGIAIVAAYWKLRLEENKSFIPQGVLLSLLASILAIGAILAL